ncbi:MAG: DUF4129 domain-containing protein [Acidobacteria bacterium]|nr:DUF4129 domain-containing protein [Acidobacteriota bacterium]MCK6681791.1 hypothetical protein [Thermoanaerobaculia bacterium]
MRLDEITAVLRPRGPWESIDHGFCLVQRFWKPLYVCWVPLLLSVWLLVALPLAKEPAWALLILWWIRPVLERVPLFVLSRGLFGAPPAPREVVRALPRLFWGHLLSALFLFRAMPARSLNLPVWELEGLRGMARWRRSSILSRDVRAPATLLTIGMSLLELFVILGLSALASFLFPERESGFLALDELFSSSSGGDAQLLLLVWLFFVSQSLLGPFYVGAGFALYIDRRTLLEGWDIEISFRNLARRLTSAAPYAVLIFCLAATQGAWASETSVEPGSTETSPPVSVSEKPQEGETPEATIARILAHPDFATKRTVTRWVPKKPFQRKLEEKDRDLLSTVDGISAVWSVVRPVLAGLVVVVVLVLLWRFARRAWDERPLPDKKAPGPAGRPRLGRLSREEALPADISAASLEAWNAGNPEAALSLLYRAAVERLVLEGALLTAASTEQDCIDQAGRLGPPHRSDYVRRIVSAWQALAFAHRSPGEEEGRNLCRNFNSAFSLSGGLS